MPSDPSDPRLHHESAGIEARRPRPELISFTAKLVAYARRLSDVPFATDVANLTDASREFAELLQGSEVDERALSWMVPMLEARYKSLRSALQRSGIKQVLELASGVALRGLAMTRDPRWTYVETDLPEITAEKMHLIDAVRARHGLKAEPGLHVEVANVLSWEELEPTLRHFDPKAPVAVIHEGLLPYLSRAEKDLVAEHVARILRRFGGLWITPDFASREYFDAEHSLWKKLGPLVDRVIQKTGRDFYAAAFEDEAAVLAFCERHGFKAQVRPQIDGSFELTSLTMVSVDSETMSALHSQLHLWELSLRGH